MIVGEKPTVSLTATGKVEVYLGVTGSHTCRVMQSAVHMFDHNGPLDSASVPVVAMTRSRTDRGRRVQSCLSSVVSAGRAETSLEHAVGTSAPSHLLALLQLPAQGRVDHPQSGKVVIPAKNRHIV